MMTGPDGTKAAMIMRSSVRASVSPDQALRLSTRWKAVKLGCSAKPKVRRQFVTVRGPTANSAPVASAAVVERVRRENAIKKGASQVMKLGGRLRSGRTMTDLQGYVGAAGLNKAEAGWIASAANPPTLAPGLASQSRDTGKVEARSLA